MASFLALLASQPRCFERDCFEDGHVTGSCWILNPTKDKVLLALHKKLNMWIQLGGHSDGDPNTLQVANREAREESGLKVFSPDSAIFDLDIHHIPVYQSDPAHKHYDVRFLFEASDLIDFAMSDESLNMCWVKLDEVEELTQETSILRMVERTRGLRN